jgi:hypothetical protein
MRCWCSLRDYRRLLLEKIMDPLEKAMEWARLNHLAASNQHKAAFANSVSYLVTGGSGGYGGPSLREHLVSWSLAGASASVETIAIAGEAMTLLIPDGSVQKPGQWSFDAAIAFCDPLCFNPAIKYKKLLIQISEREHCFDDDLEDLKSLRGKSATV